MADHKISIFIQKDKGCDRLCELNLTNDFFLFVPDFDQTFFISCSK